MKIILDTADKLIFEEKAPVWSLFIGAMTIGGFAYFCVTYLNNPILTLILAICGGAMMYWYAAKTITFVLDKNSKKLSVIDKSVIGTKTEEHTLNHVTQVKTQIGCKYWYWWMSRIVLVLNNKQRIILKQNVLEYVLPYLIYIYNADKDVQIGKRIAHFLGVPFLEQELI